MIDIAAKKTMNRRCGHELHIQATVIAAGQARLALIADSGRLHSNPISYFERLYRGMNRQDLASGFVTEDVVMLNHHGTDAAMAPKVDV